jgi:hypothetical protein
MAHTTIGLFPNLLNAEQAINELKAAGVAADDLRVIAEPRYMHVTGVLSTPEIDFCAELDQDLRAMGVTEPEVQAYIRGMRNGGVLVFACGSIAQVENFTSIMNRHEAANVEELTGMEPVLPGVAHESAIPAHGYSAQAGRVRCAGGGARMFVW